MKKLTLFTVIILYLVLVSCTMKKAYVGEYVGRYNQYWCIVDSLPYNCSRQDNAFYIEYTVRRGETSNEYVIEGIIDGSHGDIKSFNHLVTHECDFRFLIAQNGTIIDNISFLPRGNWVNMKLPFAARFTATDFDALYFTWKVRVRG